MVRGPYYGSTTYEVESPSVNRGKGSTPLTTSHLKSLNGFRHVDHSLFRWEPLVLMCQSLRYEKGGLRVRGLKVCWGAQEWIFQTPVSILVVEKVLFLPSRSLL